MAALPSWARIGAKVVCIDNGRRVAPSGGWTEPEVKPKVGNIYTIRKVGMCADDLCLWLVEVRQNQIGKFWGLVPYRFEIPYLIVRFAPAVNAKESSSTTADIATHFAHHLDTKVTEKN